MTTMVRALCLLAATGLACSSSALAAQDVDLLIENARIVDGTGNPWFRGDVAIDGGLILAVGNGLNVKPRQRIDAEGRVVSPGFIDIHTHVESGIVSNPRADNFLLDGVTTIVTGNCGGSTVDIPVWRQSIIEPAINVATFVGHNSVRESVMGREDRAPLPSEMEQMEALVERAMLDGAVGFSTGLLYVPGTFATTDEVIRLARVAAKYDGIYATHLREQGALLLESINEAAVIGREAGIPIQISHLKIKGPARWGSIHEAINLIKQLRESGLEVAADAYPYERASTGLSITLPAWASAGSAVDILERLGDPDTVARIREEMKVGLAERGYDDYSFATVAHFPPDPSLDGLTISEINRNLEREPTIDNEIDAIFDLMSRSAERGDTKGAQMVYHFMSIEDVEEIYQYDGVAVASDGWVIEFGSGAPHPRSYGTNARVLSEFVRDKGTLTLADAIRKMTSLPAQIVGIADRGLVREGFAADLVIFDPAVVQDDATYNNPHQYSRGFDTVIVNGVVVVDRGTLTNARAGHFVDGPGVQK